MDYWSVISAYRFRYPHVRYLESVSNRYWNKSTPRATVLEFWPDRVEARVFDTLGDLKSYLESPPGACKNHLYLVEDLSRELVSILGDHFWIDPYVFACQSNTSFWSESTAYGRPSAPLSTKRDQLRSWESYAKSGSTRAPSSISTTLSCTIRYLEALELKSDPIISSCKSNDNLGRELRWDKLDPEDRAFLVRRNASLWARKMGFGWDAIIFSDPPVTFEDRSLSYYTYQHGYCDVDPWPDSREQGDAQNHNKGPFRKTLLDDIKFYWTARAGGAERQAALDDPLVCGHYLKQISVSQWTVSLEYLRKKVAKCQRNIWKFEVADRDVKELYKSIRLKDIANASQWVRKVSFYIDWLQFGLESLGFTRDCNGKALMGITDGSGLFSDDADYRLILDKLKNYRAELDSALSTVTAMSQTVQGSVSLTESARATKLSVIGLIFIPLAYIASLFSMAGDFEPGGSQFWIYFVVAVPLSVLMLISWKLTLWFKH